jgi:hypothetical protein
MDCAHRNTGQSRCRAGIALVGCSRRSPHLLHAPGGSLLRARRAHDFDSGRIARLTERSVPTPTQPRLRSFRSWSVRRLRQ